MGNKHSGNYRDDKMTPQQRYDAVMAYVVDEKPAIEIAKKYKVTRQYIHHLVKKWRRDE